MAKINFETILKAIKKYEAVIKAKSQKEMQELFSKLEMDLTEIVYWQREKSVAQMQETIDYETAMLIYNELNRWNNKKNMTPNALAKRIVLTQVFERIHREKR